MYRGKYKLKREYERSVLFKGLRIFIPILYGIFFGLNEGVAGESKSKLSRMITMLCEDAQGWGWAATEGAGLRRFMIDPEGKLVFKTVSFEGLEGRSFRSVAADWKGRIWAGNADNGVSIWNGQKWQHYDVLQGPIGERINDIAVDFKRKEVWLATSGGLTKWSEKDNRWTHYTRADGLVSDQLESVAVGNDGLVVVGTQCDGLIIGRWVTSKKMRWDTVQGNELEARFYPFGKGLPSNQINDVLIAKNGSIFVATSRGLAIGTKGGKSWKFVRGRNYLAYLKGLYRPKGSEVLKQVQKAIDQFDPSMRPKLFSSDFIETLAEDPSGKIWVGCRMQGIDIYDPKKKEIIRKGFVGFPEKKKKKKKGSFRSPYLNNLLCMKNGAMISGYFGDEIYVVQPPLRKNSVSAKKDSPASFPAPQSPPTIEELKAYIAKIEALPPIPTNSSVVYLGDDWVTQGDFLGRHGRKQAMFCAVDSPMDIIQYSFSSHNKFSFVGDYYIDGKIGPHKKEVGGKYKQLDRMCLWLHWENTQQRRCLYVPLMGNRIQASWNDDGEVYPLTFEGPDLWVLIKIAQGVHQVDLYFVNPNGHDTQTRYRDYLIEFKPYKAGMSDYTLQFSSSVAHTRVKDFYTGVYKSFLLNGPGYWKIHIHRNRSFNTMVSGIMIQRKQNISNCFNAPQGYIYSHYYAPRYELSSNRSDRLEVAENLWQAIYKGWRKIGIEKYARRGKLLAYRAAEVEYPPKNMLTNWRWYSNLWTSEDRALFDKKTKDSVDFRIKKGDPVLCRKKKFPKLEVLIKRAKEKAKKEKAAKEKL